MKKLILSILVVVSLTACHIIPKTVEFGQDKVKKLPSHSEKQLEAEKQAVALAGQKAREAQEIAQADNSAAAEPAGDSAELSESVGRALGPPSEPWYRSVNDLKVRLDNLTAKYNRSIEGFREENDQNAGKKIEGTGFLQIPYFLYIGILIAVVFIAWNVIKMMGAAANPGVAVGMKVAQVGGKALGRAFSQVVKGGEDFEKWVEAKFKDSPQKAEILDAFKSSHKVAQDQDVKNLVDQLTK